MSTFEAQYGGYCRSCDGRIRIGELATYADSHLVHAECEAAARLIRKAEICTQCWLTKPCDCEDAA